MSFGHLGIGNSTQQDAFVKVDLGGKKAVSLGAGHLHNLVALEGGELWSAGWNDFGQLMWCCSHCCLKYTQDLAESRLSVKSDVVSEKWHR